MMKSHRKALGKRLFDLAVQWSRHGGPSTQHGREAAIKAMRRRKAVIHGSRSLRAAREAVDTAVDAITAARDARRPSHHRVTRAHIGVLRRRRPPVLLPQGPLEDRLRARIARLIRNAYEQCYRTDTSPKVRIAKEPADIGISQSTWLDWDYYPSSVRFPKHSTGTDITAPREWLSRVMRRHLIVLDGLMTLNAQEESRTLDGVAVYRAVWLQQHRGYAISAESGYVAVAGADAYHAEDAGKAVRGLERRLRARRREREARLVRHEAVEIEHDEARLRRLIAEHPDVRINLSDARAVGACETGIRSWCARTGIDYEAGSASLADVYAAYRGPGRNRMALTVILHVLRRQRKAA